METAEKIGLRLLMWRLPIPDARYCFNLTLALMLLVTVMESQADWAMLTEEEMFGQSDLVLLGEYLGDTPVALQRGMNLGVIKVEEILKGHYDSPVLLIKVQHKIPGTEASSTDFYFKPGQYGLWYLQRDEKGIYVASRPDSFVRKEDAWDRIKKLRSIKNPSP